MSGIATFLSRASHTADWPPKNNVCNDTCRASSHVVICATSLVYELLGTSFNLLAPTFGGICTRPPSCDSLQNWSDVNRKVSRKTWSCSLKKQQALGRATNCDSLRCSTSPFTATSQMVPELVESRSLDKPVAVGSVTNPPWILLASQSGHTIRLNPCTWLAFFWISGKASTSICSIPQQRSTQDMLEMQMEVNRGHPKKGGCSPPQVVNFH